MISAIAELKCQRVSKSGASCEAKSSLSPLRVPHPRFLRVGLRFSQLQPSPRAELRNADPPAGTHGSETATSLRCSPRSTPNPFQAARQTMYTTVPYPPHTFAPSPPRQPHFLSTWTSPRRPFVPSPG